MPKLVSNCLAIAPQATRAAVSRADARSSTLRKSCASYFRPPAKSAWPGRGRFTRRDFSGAISLASAAITSFQFAQSLFSIVRANGEPSENKDWANWNEEIGRAHV